MLDADALVVGEDGTDGDAFYVGVGGLQFSGRVQRERRVGLGRSEGGGEAVVSFRASSRSTSSSRRAEMRGFGKEVERKARADLDLSEELKQVLCLVAVVVVVVLAGLALARAVLCALVDGGAGDGVGVEREVECAGEGREARGPDGLVHERVELICGWARG